jgi:hypothetical protein
LKQALFAQDLLAVERQTDQHLPAQSAHQQIALPLRKL